MLKLTMYRASAALVALTVLGSDAANAEDESPWDIQIGAGALYVPEYEGSDDMTLEPLPFVEIEWNDRIFLSAEDGLGVHVYRGDDLEVSTSIGYEFERKESDSSDLRGLGNINGTVTAVIGVEYEVGLVTPFLELTKHLGSTEGTVLEFGVETFVPLAGASDHHDDDDGPRAPGLMIGASAEWADDNFMGDMFGISALQSERSGLPRYSAQADFKSVGAEAVFEYPIGDHWSIAAIAEYSRLVGDAADSPIVKDADQLSGGLFVTYGF